LPVWHDKIGISVSIEVTEVIEVIDVHPGDICPAQVASSSASLSLPH